MEKEKNNMYKQILIIQKKIGSMSKDSTNPFFSSQYFDINALIKEVRPVLEEHKFVLTQPIIDGKVCSIITCSETGEEIQSCLKLPELNDPQKIGSAITYYRRYTLASLLALEAEDDDGNKAAAKPSKKNKEDKEWLNENSELWDKVVKALTEKTRTVADVMAKYSVSKANQEKLKAI